MAIEDRLRALARRHAELATLLAEPGTLGDAGRYSRLSREYAELTPLAEAFQAQCHLERQLADTEALLAESGTDPDWRDLARAEREDLRQRLAAGQQELRLLLLPRDPDDARNVILEIRAGTGGDEAALFAGDLLRMYGRYAETRRWRVEILSSSPTTLGGYKEVVAQIGGADAFATLKFESGVHRVQRVPVTEAGGRIHTSACTVAVLPEAEEVDVAVDEKELRIDVYRSSGPGGQSVNTTDSAVRITHLPTGLVVICQDEKSQHKNKAKAMKVLLSRLLDAQRQAAADQRSRDRRSQVGSGDRSERIRTYNFPQGRVTDHRIGLTLHRLEQVLSGDLDELLGALRASHQADLLAALGEEG
ncbi:MAG: peptide chain release factor 1 [Magnetococcus sp. WYHC-3]